MSDLRDGVQRGIDATLLAGIALLGVDAVLALARGAIGISAVGMLLGLGIAVAIPAGVAVVVVGMVAPGLDRAMARRPRWFPVVAGVVLAVPLLAAAARLVVNPGMGLGLCAVGAVAVGAAGIWRGTRSTSRAGFLAAAVVAEQLVFAGAHSVRLADRVSSRTGGIPFVLLAGASLAGVVLAELIVPLVETVRGVRPRRGRALVAAGLGIVAVVGAILVYPDLYRAAHRAAYAAAFLLLAAGAAGLALPGGLRLRLGAMALGLLGPLYLIFFLRLPSALPWQVGSGTRVAREIVGQGAIFERALARFLAELRARPEAVAARAPHPAPAPRPSGAPLAKNLLLVTVDSLRFDHVGYSGRAPAGLTPALDALAARAVRFRRAYTQGAWTSLALPALLWSRYPKDLRFVPIFEDDDLRLFFADEIPAGATVARQFQSPRDEPTANLAEVLARAGFHTVAVPNDGSTHFLDPRMGLVRGFRDVAYPRALLGLEGKARAAATDAYAARLAAEALAQLGSGPFFLWVHFFEPHAPHLTPPGPFPLYQGEVHETDTQIGAVLQALAKSGHAGDTLVVFTADHGELFSKTDPQHGVHGVDVREALVHVPLLIAGPGLAPGDVDREVALIDLAPTMLSAVGVAIGPEMQGRDLAPLLVGEDLPSRPVYLETWYTELGTGEKMVHQIGAVEGGAKVVMDLRARALAFFDVVKDPREDQNLLAGHPDERFLALAAALVGWYGL